MRRRALCSSLALLATVGCGARPPTASGGARGDCADARLLKLNRRVEESSATDDPSEPEDYVSVSVAVTGPDPPDLFVRIVVAGEEHEYVRSVPGLSPDVDREERWDGFEFGPFGHHTVGEVRASLVGCDESIP